MGREVGDVSVPVVAIIFILFVERKSRPGTCGGDPGSPGDRLILATKTSKNSFSIADVGCILSIARYRLPRMEKSSFTSNQEVNGHTY